MTLTHPRQPPRRSAPPGTWWGKAWVRSLEESAYGEQELKGGRRLARAGAVGAIAVAPGEYVAVVDDAFTVTGSVALFDPTDASLFVEVVASGAGLAAALLTGELPERLVEGLEEVGVELVPYAGELAWSCTCRPWIDPCEHAVAVATQVGWLLQADPLVLVHLRGLPRDELLARVHELTVRTGSGSGPVGGDEPAEDLADELVEDLEAGTDAALRAQVMLGEWE